MPLTPSHTPSRDIDFLPVSYYEAGLQRKHFTLRLGVVVAFGALIVFVAIYQQFLRSMANQQLAQLQPQYEQAKQQTQRLAQLQQALQSAERRADLFTYLAHPWPRTQILAALSQPLPNEIELSEISITREPLPVTDAGGARPAAKPGETAVAKLDATQRDLQTLREQCDHSQIVVKCSGLTDDPVALHRYLEQLSHDRLLAKVEVGNMERVTGDPNGRIRFVARLVVRAGYGQPSGPKPGADAVTTSTTISH